MLTIKPCDFWRQFALFLCTSSLFNAILFVEKFRTIFLCSVISLRFSLFCNFGLIFLSYFVLVFFVVKISTSFLSSISYLISFVLSGPCLKLNCHVPTELVLLRQSSRLFLSLLQKKVRLIVCPVEKELSTCLSVRQIVCEVSSSLAVHLSVTLVVCLSGQFAFLSLSKELHFSSAQKVSNCKKNIFYHETFSWANSFLVFKRIFKIKVRNFFIFKMLRFLYIKPPKIYNIKPSVFPF